MQFSQHVSFSSQRRCRHHGCSSPLLQKQVIFHGAAETTSPQVGAWLGTRRSGVGTGQRVGWGLPFAFSGVLLANYSQSELPTLSANMMTLALHYTDWLHSAEIHWEAVDPTRRTHSDSSSGERCRLEVQDLTANFGGKGEAIIITQLTQKRQNYTIPFQLVNHQNNKNVMQKAK